MRQSRELHEAIQRGAWRRSPGLLLQRALARFDVDRGAACLALVPPCDRLLDIGCGTGRFLHAAAGRFRLGWGVDPVVAGLRGHGRGGRPSTPRLLLVNGAAEALPFAAATVDVVTMISVLQFTYDPYGVLAEAGRVLRPGGVLVLETNNLVYLPRRLALLCGRLPRTSVSAVGWDGGTLHYFTRPALAALLRETGFEPLAWSGSGVFARWRRWWPAMLCGDLIVRAVKRGGAGER
ncbi:MAG TPA: methyltransferase domain-containing protein [Thermomicrobiales bacterium]|nr:methyltransferase domain-containing protein [Thermomicrobiales bacterium]